MKLISDSPWYLLAAAFTLSLLASILLYYRNRKNKEASAMVIWSLSGLRFISTFLVLLLLAGFLFRKVLNETEYPKILLAVDNSGSMVAGSDSTFVRSELIPKLDALRREVSEKYEVHTMYFGSSVSAGEAPAPAFGEKETDINALLETVSNNYANQNIGALVVLSDGIYNKGASPVYASENMEFPVYTVGIGDTVEKQDLLIKKIDHNQIAYLGNKFPVEVHVAARKYNGRIQVDLLEGTVVKASREINIGSANFSERVTFTLTASASGPRKFTARVSGAGNEINTRNNRRDFVVEVIDNKEKILLIAAAPHPDIAAIRETVASNTAYQLDLAYLNEKGKNPEAYNLVIIHGYTTAAKNLVETCTEKKIPFWIINPETTETLPGVRISTTMKRYNDAEPVYNRSFGYFTISDQLRTFVDELPAIKTFFGNYSMPAGSSALLSQRLGSVETEQPVLFFNSSGESRFGVFIGEGLWKWKMRDFASHGNHKLFAELLSKCIQYLAARTDKSYFRVKGPRIVSENDNIEMDAELYNKSYQIVNEPDVSITLTNEQGNKFNYTFSKTASSYHLDIGTLPAGQYGYRATVSLAGEVFVKEGRIIVEEIYAEGMNTVANHELLQQVSLRSGGRFFRKTNLGELSNTLLQNDDMKAVVYSQTLTRPLIDEKTIFFILLLLFSAEWFIRKRYLLI